MYENMYETATTSSRVKIANGGADTRATLWRQSRAKGWYFELADNSFETFVTARFANICVYVCSGRKKSSLSYSYRRVSHGILNETHFACRSLPQLYKPVRSKTWRLQSKTWNRILSRNKYYKANTNKWLLRQSAKKFEKRYLNSKKICIFENFFKIIIKTWWSMKNWSSLTSNSIYDIFLPTALEIIQFIKVESIYNLNKIFNISL